MAHFHAIGIAKDGNSFHDIAEFPNVSRPVVALHVLHGLGREAADLRHGSLDELLQEVGHKNGDVALGVGEGAAGRWVRH